MDDNNSTNMPVEIEKSSAPDTASLDTNISNIAKQIIEEQDVAATKDLVELFNWNMSKKQAIRLLKLNGLYEQITDQMIERFNRRSGEFSNSDLLNYLQTIEGSLEKTQKGLTGVQTQPQIQVQQNTQVNVNVVDTFDSESKGRIADAIKLILKGTGESNSDSVVDVTDFVEKSSKDEAEQK